MAQNQKFRHPRDLPGCPSAITGESDWTLIEFSVCSISMEQANLFPDFPTPLTDDETVSVLRAAIGRGIRRSREADLYLTSMCARYIVDELRLAGLVVVRPPPAKLRDCCCAGTARRRRSGLGDAPGLSEDAAVS